MKTDSGNCGIARALDVIGGKWTMLIIRDLIEGPRRFSELEHSLAGISPQALHAPSARSSRHNAR